MAWYDTTKKGELVANIATRLDLSDVIRPPCAGWSGSGVANTKCTYWNPVAITKYDHQTQTTVIPTIKCCHNPAGQQQDFTCYTPT